MNSCEPRTEQTEPLFAIAGIGLLRPHDDGGGGVEVDLLGVRVQARDGVQQGGDGEAVHDLSLVLDLLELALR